ncbi:hypothetical protein [Bacillus horti]|uniref:NADH:ubiquinone oxidoreductase subunit 3 (Subunit A) n=1 Tax=Caldalkalibacillus horti TaxID=77523 RepID=A0ABT9W277_9BACI|nr:hypothetical protein [Bacillus horti]MDQ0167352.1 NADH:ubiquinone oxidoreductase subunit 3 (subunit A) [Bacillus horti]
MKSMFLKYKYIILFVAFSNFIVLMNLINPSFFDIGFIVVITTLISWFIGFLVFTLYTYINMNQNKNHKKGIK